ncbi:hypothetical protein [Teredinibacter purpureus]|uniref:hypothetical protein n=1 Tax=Teredinibacter purpureus TaxID=2731756 RepID=UPI0005F7981C|nr:hypothetical protein [Teredinibacter purpureus]
MNRQTQLDHNKAYLQENGLNALLNFEDNLDYTENAFDSVSGELAIALPPETDDLVRLHKLIRQRKCFTVLEFGIGYSTVIIADALEKNEREWEKLPNRPSVRNRFMFQLFSVDASAQWIATTQRKLPTHLSPRIHLQHSGVEIGTFNGQMCHYYTHLPNIVADFIYLDGPDPKDVKGTLNGLSFQCDERTVMAADLLLMEPTLLPGTLILVDGRTNNARFLARNFSRDYATHWSPEQDITTFELNEERLGKYNILGTDYFPQT